jgi:hypothetical protein
MSDNALRALLVGPYIRLCETLLARITGIAPTSPVPEATFVDGVAHMEVLDAIRASAGGGGAQITLR